MNKQKLIVVLFFLALVAITGFVALSPTDPTGSAFRRVPSLLVPDNTSIVKYYDEEFDVVCWIFTKRLPGEQEYGVTSSCLPRNQLDW